MKIFNIIATLLIFNLATFAQGDANDIVSIRTDIYEVLYNVEYQQPVQVSYSIYCTPDSPTYDRDGISFKAYPGLNGSSSSDYTANVYDKGHMAPANTFACKESWLRETFSYANCALQHQGLNRGTWAALERFERNLAGVYQDIEVHIEIYFSDKWTTNSDPARIPSNFVKVITWVQDGKEKSISFDFPNEDTTGKSFWQFQIK